MNEVYFLELTVLYLCYLVYFSLNLYFLAFYLFLGFFFIGITLAFFNLDIFVAFFWLSECVIIFITILLLFYLNISANTIKMDLKMYNYKFFYVYFFFIFFFVCVNIPFNSEINLNYFNNYLNIYFDNYYESLFNHKQNDLFGLYLSYYLYNSFEMISFGFLLLLASLVCVNLNKFLNNFKFFNYSSYFNLFNFFIDLIDFSILRKQNLIYQNQRIVFTKIFKKKSVI